MKIRIVLTIFIVLFIIIGTYLLFLPHDKRKVTSKHALPAEPTLLPTLAGIHTTYVGNFPCAGCSGLRTELSFYRHTPTDTSGTYDLITTEIGTNGKPTEIQGTWKTVTGDKSDPKATVFETIPTNSSDIRYFTKLDDKRLMMLSKQMVEMKSAKYILMKQ